MNTADQEIIDDILDNFNFERVKKVVDVLKWRYYDSDDETCSIAELRRMARRVLTDAVTAKESEEYRTACGGFEADRYMYLGDAKKYVDLKFVVTEMGNY